MRRSGGIHGAGIVEIAINMNKGMMAKALQPWFFHDKRHA
jgi:hypothetical protein